VILEPLGEGRRIAGADLGGRAADVQQALAAVVEDGQRPPTLELGFALVEHRKTLLGREKRKTAAQAAPSKGPRPPRRPVTPLSESVRLRGGPEGVNMRTPFLGTDAFFDPGEPSKFKRVSEAGSIPETRPRATGKTKKIFPP